MLIGFTTTRVDRRAIGSLGTWGIAGIMSATKSALQLATVHNLPPGMSALMLPMAVML